METQNPTRFVEALAHFKLDWKVETRPLFTFDNEGKHLLVEDAKSIVRTDLGMPLSVVGNRYVTLQNDVAGDVVDGVLSKTGGEYIKGGVFGYGRKVYLQAKLPDSIIVKGRDASAKLLTFITSHDSSSLMYIGFTAVRIICQNTFMMALRDLKNQIAIRHTVSAEQRLSMAQEILEGQLAYFRELEVKANWLADQRFNDLQMDLAMRKVLGVKADEKDVPTRTKNIMDTILGNFQNYDDADGGNAWTAYNAFTYFSNHQKGTRVGDDVAAQNDRRFENVLVGQGIAFNQKALESIESVLLT